MQIRSAFSTHWDEDSIHIGVSRLADSLMTIPNKYREAVFALETGPLIKQDRKTHYYEKLGAYRLFLNHPNSKELHSFSQEILKPLFRYDVENKTDLVDTLAHLVEQNGNQKQAAKSMFVHPKTLSYRKKRIEEILDVRLDDADDFYNLKTVLVIHRISRAIDPDRNPSG